MKIKSTRKAMKENYNKIISIGYCNLQSLLHFEQPIAYSTRAEGWACDYYDVEGVLISTGYAPIESRNTHSTYDIAKKYDDLAEKIIYGGEVPYEERKDKVTELLHQYIKEVC